MSYRANFKGTQFDAEAFSLRLRTSPDTLGKPSSSGCHAIVELWIDSSDVTKLDTSSRTTLFQNANFHRNDDKNKEGTMTVGVALDHNQGSHTYTFTQAWLQGFSEYQQLTRRPSTVDVTFRQVNPRENLSGSFAVTPGQASHSVLLHLTFYAFLKKDSDAKLG